MSLSAPARSQPLRAHGLEWLPAPAPPDGPSSTTQAPPRPPRPLVVILPWMWAARAAVSRHAALYHSLGCDVAVFSGWPPLSVWLPSLARRNASALLSGLAAHLRDDPRDVLIACFSGAAKGILAPLLDLLFPGVTAAAVAAAQPPGAPQSAAAEQACPSTSEGTPAPTPSAAAAGVANPIRRLLVLLPGPLAARLGGVADPPPRPAQPAPQPPSQPRDLAAALLLSHLRGVLFDSGPVDFDSSVGVRLFATARNPALRSLQAAAGSVAAGALDFCLHEAFESQRRSMWVGLRACLAAARLPVLFLYSWRGDALADPQPIHAMAVALRVDAAAAATASSPTASSEFTTAAAPGAAGGAAAAAGRGGDACSCSGAGPGGAGRNSCGAASHEGPAGSCSACGRAAAAPRHGGGWPASGSGSSSSTSSTSSTSTSSSSSTSSRDDIENASRPSRSDTAGSHPGDQAGGDGAASATAPPRSPARTTSGAGGPGNPRAAASDGRCRASGATGGCGCGSGSNSRAVASQPDRAAPPLSQCPACRRAAAYGGDPVRVWEQGWDVSGHVAHLRQHSDQYRYVVQGFLDSCLSRGGGAPTGSGPGSVSKASVGGARSGAGAPASKL